jgi:hypothetical protein
MGSNGKALEATIKWVCWSPYQINFLRPYFLTNGISCVVEWGWNDVTGAPLDLNDIEKLRTFVL